MRSRLVHTSRLACALAFACALALACALAFVPAVALAVPGASVGASSALDAKKAEEAGAKAELDRMRTELDRQTAEYVNLTRRIDKTQREVSEASSEAVKLEASLVTAQVELRERAVQLYRVGDVTMIEILLTSRSAEDFVARARYLAMIAEADIQLLNRLRLLRSEKLYLEGSLSQTLKRLVEMESSAEDQRKALVDGIAAQQGKVKQLGSDIVQLMTMPPPVVGGGVAGASPTSSFNPDTVISEANFTASGSMSAAQIQAFLDTQPGTLKSFRAPDHNGVDRSVAEMIAEASTAWAVSPKVILVTLQKEQSLLSNASPAQKAYDWAMGCGKADSRTYYEFQGFGKQIWFGANKLRNNANLWTPGATQDIDGSTVHPTNPGTHAQYRYTPHFNGVMSFWMLYWRYFGDPLAG